MKLTNIGPNECQAIRMAVANALRAVEEEMGVSINLGHMTYTGSEVRCKMTTRVAQTLTLTDGVLANAPSQMERDFIEQAHVYGLDASDLHNNVVLNGNAYEIVGLKPRSRKYPIICKRLVGGKMFKFSAGTVRFALGSA